MIMYINIMYNKMYLKMARCLGFIAKSYPHITWKSFSFYYEKKL